VSSNAALAPPAEFVVHRQASVPRIDSVVLYGTVSLILFGPLAFGCGEPWSRFILEAGSAGLLLVWISGQVRGRALRITGNPLFTPMLAFAALTIFQLAAGLSAYRSKSLSSALLYAAYGCICFLVVQCLRRGSQIGVLATTLSIYGVLLATFAVLQSLTSTNKLYWMWKPEFGGWIFGPYVNHNHYAGLMEMLVPIPLVCSFTAHVHRRTQMIAIGAAAWMAGTIFLSGSRGGMAAFLVEIVVLLIIVLRKRLHAKTGRVMAIFFIVVFALLAWLGGDQVADRLASVKGETRSEISGGTRLSIDRDALTMFEQRPLAGWGLGVFSDVYPRFRSFYTTFYVNRAHNDYLQLLVEMGAVGFALMIWSGIRLYRCALRRIAKWELDTDGAVALATMTACTGILVHSWVDSNLQIPGNAMLFYVMCAVAVMEPRFGSSRRVHRHHRSVIETVF
jgi:O-antigen ligase